MCLSVKKASGFEESNFNRDPELGFFSSRCSSTYNCKKNQCYRNYIFRSYTTFYNNLLSLSLNNLQQGVSETLQLANSQQEPFLLWPINSSHAGGQGWPIWMRRGDPSLPPPKIIRHPHEQFCLHPDHKLSAHFIQNSLFSII